MRQSADGAKCVIPGIVIAILAVIMSGFLIACSPGGGGGASDNSSQKESEEKLVGPSDNKARLDFDEFIGQLTSGMVSVENFEVLRRDVLAEDRVNIDIQVTFKSDPVAMQRFEAMAKRDNQVFGRHKYEPPKMLVTARSLDGQELKMRMKYRFRGNGVWEWTNGF